MVFLIQGRWERSMHPLSTNKKSERFKLGVICAGHLSVKKWKKGTALPPLQNRTLPLCLHLLGGLDREFPPRKECSPCCSHPWTFSFSHKGAEQTRIAPFRNSHRPMLVECHGCLLTTHMAWLRKKTELIASWSSCLCPTHHRRNQQLCRHHGWAAQWCTSPGIDPQLAPDECFRESNV